MNWKIIFSFVFSFFIIVLLFLYWFAPLETFEFETHMDNSNFSIGDSELKNMQFYPQMRYPNSKISYKIYDCSLQKQNDMQRAFEILENLTMLEFYPVLEKEEISVFCEDKNRIEEGLFIAGEGGPVNITKTSNFNVIRKGKILLIKDFKCDIPNVALHELLHTLGFDHSSNKNNIMYETTKCGQTIGYQIPNLINKLYSVKSSSDLSFEEISALMHGKYLDANISIRNNGLKKTKNFKIVLYGNEKIIKEIEIEGLEIGYGKIINLENMWVPQLSINELTFKINYDFEELSKGNNVAVLKIEEK